MGTCTKENPRSGWSLHEGGAMVKKADDVDAYVDSIRWCLAHAKWRNTCGERNRLAANNFSLEKVEKTMREIYRRASAKESLRRNVNV